MQEVMQCLNKYGQRLDLQIAAEMRVPLATVRYVPAPAPGRKPKAA